jgi:hypothetical protein
MITCASVRIARLAIAVSCTDCSIQSVDDSRITMRPLHITISGVTSIDSTIAAHTGFIHSPTSRWLLTPSASSTKPNSPACARYSPVRIAPPGVARKARASSATSTALASTGSVVNKSTSSH